MIQKQQGSSRFAAFAGRILKVLGPGLVTGASDDDLSGIGTYSQAGAQLGFGIGWTMLITLPLMVAIQEISARIGRTTGHGIAGNLRRHSPNWLLYAIVALLFVANTINIGADLSAMGDAIKLLIGGPSTLYAILFGTICVVAMVFIDYVRYVTILKWMTLVLFAYVASLLAIEVPWREALVGVFVPRVTWGAAFFTTLVAIFGTTISPYLFFWQASQEVDEERAQGKTTVAKRKGATEVELRVARTDVLVGMFFSNLVMYFIILTTAATLHAHGSTDIQTAQQAALALRPLAGQWAYLLFTLGIIGTGMLAVPVLAGSAAYAIAEAEKWRGNLESRPNIGKRFYAVVAISMLLGLGLDFVGFNAVKMLFYSAVLNGVLAPPLIVLVTLLTSNPKVMSTRVSSPLLRILGWGTAVIMTIAAIGMFLTL